jgi:hypothetical protein
MVHINAVLLSDRKDQDPINIKKDPRSAARRLQIHTRTLMVQPSWLIWDVMSCSFALGLRRKLSMRSLREEGGVGRTGSA